MPSPIHSILRRVKSYIHRILTRLGLRLCRFFIGENNPRITFAVDSEKLEDGLGAQIQRQLSLKSLANYLKVEFIPNPIRQIAIHPFDNFSDIEQMREFLNDANNLFRFNLPNDYDFSTMIRVGNLKIGNLMRLILVSRLRKTCLSLLVLEAYSIVDADPQIYAEALIGYSLNTESVRMNQRMDSSDICIHYRQGSGGNAIYPGQRISRELNPQYFIDLLHELDAKGKVITLFTDAPIQKIDFKPNEAQKHLWLGTPGYKDGTITIQGLDLKSVLARAGFEVKVVIGGDLITTFLGLIDCKTLIMSRSSLSYVAALLNKNAKIYYPPNFWHPPLKSWIKVK